MVESRIEIAERILKDKTKPAMPIPLTYMDEIKKIWGKKWGAQSEIGKLKEVLVCRPDWEMNVPEEEMRWCGLWGSVDLKKAQEEHDKFVDVLKAEGVKVYYLKTERKGPYAPLCKSWAPRDPGIVINGGAIVSRMSLPFRRGDEYYWARTVMELGCPILYTVHGRGTFEGGNVIWLDPEHVCIGRSIRTNQAGIDQVIPILKMAGVQEIRVVPIPGYMEEVPSGFPHLDCIFNMADEGLAVIYPNGVPFDFIEYLKENGLNLIEIPREDGESAAANHVALEPGKVINAAGFEKTRKKLEKEGVDVIEVEWTQWIVRGGGGGIHCATGPLIREPGPLLK